MAVSPEDRAKWDRQVAALREIETESPSRPAVRAARIADANRWRESHGIPPLADEAEEYPPEMEFFERARRLGLLKKSR